MTPLHQPAIEGYLEICWWHLYKKSWCQWKLLWTRHINKGQYPKLPQGLMRFLAIWQSKRWRKKSIYIGPVLTWIRSVFPHIVSSPNVGHQAEWCPNITCQKCEQPGHTKIHCMSGLEDMPLPNEVLLKILNSLNPKDLGRCAQVNRKFHYWGFQSQQYSWFQLYIAVLLSLFRLHFGLASFRSFYLLNFDCAKGTKMIRRDKKRRKWKLIVPKTTKLW